MLWEKHILDNNPQKRITECQALLQHEEVNIFTFTAIWYNTVLSAHFFNNHLLCTLNKGKIELYYNT